MMGRVTALVSLVGSSILNTGDAMQMLMTRGDGDNWTAPGGNNWTAPDGTKGTAPGDGSLQKELASGVPHTVELVDDPFTVDFSPHGEPGKPRMLAMRGCSGSSAIMVYARNLLRYHGIPVPAASEVNFDDDHKATEPIDRGLYAELLNPKVNWLFKDAGNDIGKAMDMQNERIRTKNQTLFFKGMIQHMQGNSKGPDEWASLKPTFQKLGLFAVLGARKNMLDQVICQVKDCFQEDYGVPMDADGKESELCFHRRGAQDNPTAVNKMDENPTTDQMLGATRDQENKLDVKNAFYMEDDIYRAKLRPEHLLRSIQRELTKVGYAKIHLENLDPNVKTIYEEDLLEFQTPIEGAFDRAVGAWCDLLTSLGATPDKTIVTKFLAQYANTYHEPPAHWQVIWNYDEIKKIMKTSEYAHMLRE